MIRIEHIIKRDELFQWIENPDICRVEISRRNNNGLKDKSVCKIHAFHRISISGGDHITMILGGCKKVVEDNDALPEAERFLSEIDHAFLNGIQNQLHYNWLSRSMIKVLLDIQKRYPKINLGIPKKIINIVEKYNETNRQN